MILNLLQAVLGSVLVVDKKRIAIGLKLVVAQSQRQCFRTLNKQDLLLSPHENVASPEANDSQWCEACKGSRLLQELWSQNHSPEPFSHPLS